MILYYLYIYCIGNIITLFLREVIQFIIIYNNKLCLRLKSIIKTNYTFKEKGCYYIAKFIFTYLKTSIVIIRKKNTFLICSEFSKKAR